MSFTLSWILRIQIFLSVFSQTTASAQAPIPADGSYLGLHLQTCFSSQNIQELVRYPNLFVKSKENVPNVAPQDVPIWLKLEFPSSQLNNQDLILKMDNPLFKDVRFYTLFEGVLVDSSLNGTVVPLSKRQIYNHMPTYQLPKGFKKGKVEVFIRIQSEMRLQIPLMLYSNSTMPVVMRKKALAFGLFAGIILAMLFYNLFIYFTVKDYIYLFYVIYILIVGIIQAIIEGYALSILWPEFPSFALDSFYYFTALVNITGLYFASKFLHTKEHAPGWHKISYLFYLLYSISIMMVLLGFQAQVYQLYQVSAGLVSLYMLLSGVIAVNKKQPSAYFFLIAWSALIIGIIIYVLKDFSILPYTNFTHRSIEIGAALEVILLSFALADRINILKRENEKIINERNAFLELEVMKQTHELKESNDNLQNTLNDLKQTQTQLVNAEKMASLGQLTAGIAHEINNPINFVSSNINPLKRDIGDLYEMIDGLLAIQPDQPDLPNQVKALQKLSRELDYDYLKDELGVLLKGMEEGAVRTVEIVKGLKNFSRLDEAESKLANLNEGIESTIILLNSSFKGRIQLVKELNSLPDIECYPGKLNQVFMNLLNNAVYATMKNLDNIDPGIISVFTALENDQILIKISDTGVGIPQDKLVHIFEPFFTTKPVGEGTGLGLSIVYSIIESHHGTIKVDSEMNKGTTFTIRIPVKRPIK